MDLGKDHRENSRKPCNETVSFLIKDPASKDGQMPSQEYLATVLDISPTGMGIAIDTILNKGQIINFINNQPKWSLPSKGVIIWSFKISSGHKAGLEFIL